MSRSSLLSYNLPKAIMTKPVLLTIDDDAEVLRAIERDLRRKYASDYRVLRAESGAAAMEIVRELKLRNNPVALFLVDQRMPGLSGVQFLEQAIDLFPDAKRVLLTAYADTDAAIAASVSAYAVKSTRFASGKSSFACSRNCTPDRPGIR